MKQRPAQGGEKETRGKLIEAGLRLFGLHGFEATSTRALAQEAGVNLSAILYHFGGKEGLYGAVVEHIVSTKLTEIGPGLLRVMTTCANPASSREELLEAMRFLVRTTVSVMLGSPESRSFSQIMMQEQIAPTAAFGLFHDGFFAKVHGVWTVLMGRLLGLPDSLELRLRALAVMGQMVVFRVGMTGILRVVGGDRLSDEHLESITRLCIQQVEAIAAGCAPASPEGPAQPAQTEGGL